MEYYNISTEVRKEQLPIYRTVDGRLFAVSPNEIERIKKIMKQPFYNFPDSEE